MKTYNDYSITLNNSINNFFKDALKIISKNPGKTKFVLQTIRQNHAELSETKGGCALWEKREWVRSLINP